MIRRENNIETQNINSKTCCNDSFELIPLFRERVFEKKKSVQLGGVCNYAE